MKSTTKTTYLIFFLILSSQILWSAANPAWYTIVLQQWGSLFNNGMNLNWNSSTNTNISFGQIQTRPATGYYTNPPFPEYEKLNIQVSVPNGEMRLYKIGDSSEWFEYSLFIQEERTKTPTTRNHYPTIFPYTFEIEAGKDNNTTNTVLYINIVRKVGGGGGAFGTYHAPIQVKVLDKDGFFLAEKTYEILVYNKKRGAGGGDLFSVLFVEQYAAAQNIDVALIQNHNATLTVGAVSFVSNEPENTYRLRISPHPLTTGLFTFINTSTPTVQIPYQVTLPGRIAISHTVAFDHPIQYTNVGGNWQDRIEVAIRNITSTNMRAGQYTSTILVELIIN